MLQELTESIIDFDDIEAELNEHTETLNKIINQLTTLVENEEFSFNTSNAAEEKTDDWVELSHQLDVVLKQMEAAKRGLGIVNKLPAGQYRAKHASRVMGIMNKLRGGIARIERDIAELLQQVA